MICLPAAKTEVVSTAVTAGLLLSFVVLSEAASPWASAECQDSFKNERNASIGGFYWFVGWLLYEQTSGQRGARILWVAESAVLRVPFEHR